MQRHTLVPLIIASVARASIIVCGVLLMTIGFFAVRSSWKGDTFFFHRVQSTEVFTVSGGLIAHCSLPHGPEAHNYWWHVDGDELLGINTSLPTAHVRLWVVMVALGVSNVSLLCFLRFLRFLWFLIARRSRGGYCLNCGYDLRATPDRCPECGVVPRPLHNQPMQRTGAAV